MKEIIICAIHFTEQPLQFLKSQREAAKAENYSLREFFPSIQKYTINLEVDIMYLQSEQG